MSKHAKPVLVRFYRGDDHGQYVLVKNWEANDGYAKFTLPGTSLIGRSLMVDGLIDLRVVVMESEEVEWAVHRVDRDRLMPDDAPYRVTCQSHVARLRNSQPTDDYVMAHFEVAL